MPSKEQPARELVPAEAIQSLIIVLRGHRVMLDRDLAILYGVETRTLNQAVRRNRDRFPEDFMFRLTPAEGKAVMALRSQNVILKRGQHLKYAPYVFTEHGAVMLVNVLKSDRAVRASILVVRAFVSLRRILASHDNVLRRLETIERRLGNHDAELREVFRILRKLLEPPPPRTFNAEASPGGSARTHLATITPTMFPSTSMSRRNRSFQFFFPAFGIDNLLHLIERDFSLPNCRRRRR